MRQSHQVHGLEKLQIKTTIGQLYNEVGSDLNEKLTVENFMLRYISWRKAEFGFRVDGTLPEF